MGKPDVDRMTILALRKQSSAHLSCRPGRDMSVVCLWMVAWASVQKMLHPVSLSFLLAGLDVTDARVLTVDGQPVVQGQGGNSYPGAQQQPLQSGPSLAPAVSSGPSSRSAYIILGARNVFSSHLWRSLITCARKGRRKEASAAAPAAEMALPRACRQQRAPPGAVPTSSRVHTLCRCNGLPT